MLLGRDVHGLCVYSRLVRPAIQSVAVDRSLGPFPPASNGGGGMKRADG